MYHPMIYGKLPIHSLASCYLLCQSVIVPSKKGFDVHVQTISSLEGYVAIVNGD